MSNIEKQKAHQKFYLTYQFVMEVVIYFFVDKVII
ncbi:hypothetical protein PTD2_16167 [Pseudoalteromonas tunicata D2]|uniref:Uncharacterized protein n=1 Tax=Pseudoalteromonas tunicata D2 TaxID=87626 RepID=A4CDE8_9GAMM|nr:hypothetical protein PTD2_16167 [Pseudoalteromonas tunicata D2]